MSSNDKLLVNTNFGPVVGFQDTHPLSDRSTASSVASGQIGDQLPINKWLGIPYAQAARWTRPTPPNSWQEPLLCHEFGPHFPQLRFPQEPLSQQPVSVEVIYLGKPGLHPRAWREQSEEKGHNLNVFLPDEVQTGDKVPVMVWIYGGALLNGSACVSMYDPTEWIRREAAEGRKFIVVTGNYRVNLFGFLSSSELAAQDEDGLSGNYGAYDCISYLQWVQDNIAKFGGDPDNVTAFGESAGGVVVSNLLLCQKKLFKNAILQSGTPGTIPYVEPKLADTFYEELCDKALKTTPQAERLAALRSLPADELLKYSPQGAGTVGFSTEQSNKGIWTSASGNDALKEGKWSPYLKSVLLGTTKDEGSIFAMLFQGVSKDGYDLMCERMYSKVPRAHLDKLYPPVFPDIKSGESPDYASSVACQLLSDQIFIAPTENCAKILSSTPNAQTGERLSVYMYKLNATVDKIEDGRGLGAFHSVDVPFIFNIKGAWSEDSTNAKTSALMGKYWYTFAKSGCPESTWPQYDIAAPFRTVFEVDGGTSVEDMAGKSELEKARHEFWNQIS
ncbi:carboxylesterase [Melampsora larici-populina 98AG31]|uniref:Carboxylesterase n=1 Tax=Melampsora larici-populina (strain 98AG31 / pathotype 3-4-7) TaxID=747676 RepID=F4RR12_MELLP|nr:carboxylesterase [Melampsora larici-populina 98AG31]EGG05225.1 carboxylesterase [Melampsora larici-populina 98AG31]